jgi:hypothetical protein
MHLGDFAPGAVVPVPFTTENAVGALVTLEGSPAADAAVYKGSSDTERTAGITVSVDFDGVTGSHVVLVDTDDVFYEAGEDYRVVLTEGTVAGVSKTGSVVGTFSLGRATLASSYDAAKTAASQTSVDDLPTNSELATALSPLALEATLGTPAGASVSADIAALPTASENADEVATRTLDANIVQISGDATAADNLKLYTDGTAFMPVDGHAPNFGVSGTTLTVYEPDGTTPAYTKTVTTDAAADPITGAS